MVIEYDGERGEGHAWVLYKVRGGLTSLASLGVSLEAREEVV